MMNKTSEWLVQTEGVLHAFLLPQAPGWLGKALLRATLTGEQRWPTRGHLFAPPEHVSREECLPGSLYAELRRATTRGNSVCRGVTVSSFPSRWVTANLKVTSSPFL